MSYSEQMTCFSLWNYIIFQCFFLSLVHQSLLVNSQPVSHSPVILQGKECLTGTTHFPTHIPYFNVLITFFARHTDNRLWIWTISYIVVNLFMVTMQIFASRLLCLPHYSTYRCQLGLEHFLCLFHTRVCFREIIALDSAILFLFHFKY
jgi:hypothetical protein